MKRVLLLACSLLVLPGLVAGQTSSQNQNTVRELMRFNQEYDAAWVRGDVAALERMLADDFTSIDEDGSLETKAQELAPLRSGDLKVQSARSDDVVVRVYGNTAVITGRWTGSGQYKGQSWNAKELYTATLVKRANRWQFVADHSSEIKPAAPTAGIIGNYTVTFAESDLPATMPQSERSQMVGTWGMAFQEGGQFVVTHSRRQVAQGPYRVAGNRLMIEAGETGPYACGTPATYTWQMNNGQLSFTKVEDACAGRASAMTARPYTRRP